MLTEQDQQFVARRRRFAASWPIIGTVVLVGLAVLVASLFWQCPLLVNPRTVASRIEAGNLPQPTLLLMAALLPYAVLLSFVIALAVVLFTFSAMANERRHVRIVEHLLHPESSAEAASGGVYMIIDIRVTDSDVYSQYVEKVADIVRGHGGRYLVRGGKITPIIGDWSPQRIIVVRFDTIDQLRKCFASAEYLALASLREKSTIARAIAVEGLPCPTTAPGA